MQNERNELSKIVRSLPQSSGVYLMKDRLGQVIYVGKAKNLKRRVSSYFQGSRRFIRAQPKIAAMVEMVREISVHQTRNETEALLLEGKLIKQYKPRYNTDFTDDKQFLLVQVDLHNKLPRFRLCRNRKEDGSHYYGPFAQAGMLRSTLAEMRKRFGILLADAKPEVLSGDRVRLYHDARAEIFAGHNETTLDEYRERVDRACSFLEGRTKELLKELREEMTKCAEAMDFERAAHLRDLSEALAKTIRKTRRFVRHWPRGDELEQEGIKSLGDVLALPNLPAVIECFDVSHVSGTFVVASMVRFINGKPDRRSYRRFKVRGGMGNDDFASMEEVVGRRYGRLRDEGKPMPDLVVIDGGAGQVGAALYAFDQLSVVIPPLIGLAKKEETIVFADDRGELKLPHRDPALRLLQRLRDEAHRFANQFNADLRSKKIRESILDDFSGLGKIKRAALLQHFGSLDALKRAKIEELRAVEGIGPKLAERLHRFLHLKPN
ncbi:excinuclease ABC subunit UvrC [Opitutales bacterium]|nr:excinuclease ABC subunit UvrC [Opitutales bacterium]